MSEHLPCLYDLEKSSIWQIIWSPGWSFLMSLFLTACLCSCTSFRSWFLHPRQGLLTKVPILFTHLFAPQSEALWLYKPFWLKCTHSNSNQPLSRSTQQLLQLSSQENSPARVCLSKELPLWVYSGQISCSSLLKEVFVFVIYMSV